MADKHLFDDPDEAAYLAGYDASAFARPSVTVDVVVATISAGAVQALLLRRPSLPHRGRWALPGTFVAMDESLDRCAERVLRDKAGLSGVYAEQLYTFGAPGRDPRTRVVSVAYLALVDAARLSGLAAAAERAAVVRLDVAWAGLEGGPVEATAGDRRLRLAFDHARILGMAVQRLRGKLDYAPIGFELLPDTFTLRRLQEIHEGILGRALNKDSFRRRMLATGWLVATGEHEAAVAYRPAELYRFVHRTDTRREERTDG